MSSVLFANPITFDIQISLTLFDKYKQVTRRGFYLRNLSGETEAEQVTHAQQILDSVAEELYYLTRYGIDKGVIKVDKKKVAETIYTDYAPHETAQYFRFGVTMTFFNLHTYLWAKKSEGRQLRTWRLAKNQWDEGWERIVKYSPERKTLRFPCLVNTTSETDFSSNIGAYANKAAR